MRRVVVGAGDGLRHLRVVHVLGAVPVNLEDDVADVQVAALDGCARLLQRRGNGKKLVKKL